MKIRMLCGTYGYRNRDGVMEAKDASSPPFEVGEEDGARLVRMGYAEPAGGRTPGAQGSDAASREQDGADVTLEGGGEAGSPPDRGRLEQMVKRDLEKMAKEMGLPYSGTREEIITRIYDSEMEEYEELQNSHAGDIPGLPPMGE